jgi:MscS family membrane protein
MEPALSFWTPILEPLPDALKQLGPGGLFWWQWIALGLLVAACLALGPLLGGATRALVSRLASRTATSLDDEILAQTRGLFKAAWTLALFWLLVPALALGEPGATGVERVLRAGFLLMVFWALLRSVDVAVTHSLRAPWAAARPVARTLVPLSGRIGKVLVIILAIITVLSEFGYPVASLIAGLGIGGLALALAGQKTVENLFGAFSIGLDQPFREGDFVKVEEVVGTVEAVGLRSTRIRTLDRTLVSIPNGKLAEMRLETFAARDRIRLHCVLGLAYSTRAEQMQEVLTGLERVLREHPLIWPDSINVRFVALAESSLNIEVMAWFQTADWNEFQTIRQEVLLRFMQVVEQAGASFAFPTRTVRVVPG